MVDDTVLAHDLGVLVVHGIGEQKRGETLTQWADALSSWLTEWSSHDDRSTVSEVVLTRASLSPERGIPANATLSLAFEAEAQANQQWLIAEGWWAGAFEPPRFFELWSWSFKSVPATAAMHANALMGTAIRRRRLEQGWARLVADARIVGLVFILVLLVLLSPVILLLLTALLIVGIVASALPILSLREAVTKAQLVAVGTIGDSQRLVESPTQAAAIKAPIVDGLTWLRSQGCPRIAVLAHSQGAAVTYKALVDLANEHHGPFDRIDTFITIGSGLPKVHALEHLSKERGLQNLRTAALIVPVAALTTTLSVLYLVNCHATLVLGGTAVIAGIGSLWALKTVMQQRRKPGETPTAGIVKLLAGATKKLTTRHQVGLFAVVVLLALVPNGVGIVAFLALASFALGVLALAIIALVEIPLIPNDLDGATGRWVDLYAAKDPVPAGPTRTTNAARPESWRVSNLGSVSRDHTTYVANADECLTYIGIELLEAVGLPIQADSMRTENANYGYRRRWRVGWRAFATWTMVAATVAFAVDRWGSPDDALVDGYGRFLGPSSSVVTFLPNGFAGIIPDELSPPVIEVVSIVCFVVLGAVAIGLGQALWNTWNRFESLREVRSNFRRQDDDVPMQFRVMIAYLALVLALAIKPAWAWNQWWAAGVEPTRAGTEPARGGTLPLLGLRAEHQLAWRLTAGIALIGLALLAGRYLSRFLSRSGIRRWVVGHSASRVDALVPFGYYQLELGETDAALATFERAIKAAEILHQDDTDALGAHAYGCDLRAQELRRSSSEDRSRIHELEEQAGKEFAAATAADRRPSIETLVRYANYLQAVRNDSEAARAMLDRAGEKNRWNGRYLGALVAHCHPVGDPSLAVANLATEAGEYHASLLPEEKLEMLFNLLVVKGPLTQTTSERAGIDRMLDQGLRAPGADLRIALKKLPGPWSEEQAADLRALAATIQGLEPTVADETERFHRQIAKSLRRQRTSSAPRRDDASTASTERVSR